MRGVLGYIIMLFISASCGASAHAVLPTHKAHSTKLTSAHAMVIDQAGNGQHCDRLEDTEESITAYNQHSTFSIMLLPGRLNQLPAIYTACISGSKTKRNNARIKPFYRLILFPFHAYW